MPELITIPAVDGYELGAFEWRHDTVGPNRSVAIVNAATSVRCRYYEAFASELHQQGYNVLTFDYRGIGESRKRSLHGESAGWLDWGERDFEGVLQYALAAFPGSALHVVGHSVGGFVIGLAPSARKIERIFTVGAQYAYWRDYALSVRPRMFVQWHLFMPVVVRLFGYLPAKRLGWMEDTPKGVALDWAHMEPQFENVLARHGTSPEALRRRFAEVRAPMLAFATTDDHFGTPAAVDRLLEYYSGSERVHLRIEPSAIDQTAIGHFAFFSRRFRDSLWPIALDWLRAETLPTIRGTALWRAADPAPY